MQSPSVKDRKCLKKIMFRHFALFNFVGFDMPGGKLDPDVISKAKAEGSVRVLVMLNDEPNEMVSRKRVSASIDVRNKVTAV